MCHRHHFVGHQCKLVPFHFLRLTTIQVTRLCPVLGLISQVFSLGTPYPKLHWYNLQLVHIIAVLSSQFYRQTYLFVSLPEDLEKVLQVKGSVHAT